MPRSNSDFTSSLIFCIRRNETHLDNLLQEFSLMFLPHLTSLSLTDVDLDTIINISVFCPDLEHLAISKSEVRSKERSQTKTCFFFKFNYSKLCNSKTNSSINFCPQLYGNISHANYIFINFHAIYLKAQCHFHFKHWMQIKIYSFLLPQFFCL